MNLSFLWIIGTILLSLIDNITSDNNWEHGHIICPKQCVCQYTHLMDLSVSRWMIRTQQTSPVKESRRFEEDSNSNSNNEVVYENTNSYDVNPLVKSAMCMIQVKSEIKDLLNSLPADVQALVMLYNDDRQNLTVATSNIRVLSELIILEIRASRDRSLKLNVDEPLAFLQYANFESIELYHGAEGVLRPKNPIHPSEVFDYVPSSENLIYNVSLETNEDTEVEILPYDVYLQEIRKTRMPSFYGWSHLLVLQIHNCKLDEVYWEMFDGLSSLQHLSLEHNEIKIVPSFAFYGALHIKSLSLAHNHILDFNYRSLAGLLDLEFLDLSDNTMSKLSELTFPPFPKLQYVDFRYNPIRYIFPATFGVMNSTRTMLFGSSDIALELTTNEPFEYLNQLIYLSLNNVSVRILNQYMFKGLSSLEVLSIKGDIFSLEFDAFSEMPKLRELDVSECGVTEISMDTFIGCKYLEVLNLSKNNLSYIPPGLLDNQPRLTEIYLNDNRLKFLPINFFDSASIKLVRLTNNPWKCSCDMVLWKPKITNKIRGPKQERCVRDFHSGKVISCKELDNYKFDKKLAPRCNNVKNHTVYYALRKDLHCNFNKEREKHVRRQEATANQNRIRTTSRPTEKRKSKRRGESQNERRHGHQPRKTRKQSKERNTLMLQPSENSFSSNNNDLPNYQQSYRIENINNEIAY